VDARRRGVLPVARPVGATVFVQRELRRPRVDPSLHTSWRLRGRAVRTSTRLAARDSQPHAEAVLQDDAVAELARDTREREEEEAVEDQELTSTCEVVPFPAQHAVCTSRVLMGEHHEYNDVDCVDRGVVRFLRRRRRLLLDPKPQVRRVRVGAPYAAQWRYTLPRVPGHEPREQARPSGTSRWPTRTNACTTDDSSLWLCVCPAQRLVVERVYVRVDHAHLSRTWQECGDGEQSLFEELDTRPREGIESSGCANARRRAPSRRAGRTW
jgi:hypothetical protein